MYLGLSTQGFTPLTEDSLPDKHLSSHIFITASFIVLVQLLFTQLIGYLKSSSAQTMIHGSNRIMKLSLP